MAHLKLKSVEFFLLSVILCDVQYIKHLWRYSKNAIYCILNTPYVFFVFSLLLPYLTIAKDFTWNSCTNLQVICVHWQYFACFDPRYYYIYFMFETLFRFLHRTIVLTRKISVVHFLLEIPIFMIFDVRCAHSLWACHFLSLSKRLPSLILLCFISFRPYDKHQP